MKITDHEHAYLHALVLAINAPTEEQSLECQKIAASIEPHLTEKQIDLPFYMAKKLLEFVT